MFTIAICDDDSGYIQKLKNLILECNQNKRKISFDEYDSGEQLLKGDFQEADAIFIDIQMEGIDGNDTLRQINKSSYSGVVVQCSGFFSPTTETVKLAPYRYIEKDESLEDIQETIREVLQEMDRRNAYYTLDASYNRKKTNIETKNVAYITHHKRGSVLHLCDEKAKEYSKGNLIVPNKFDELLEHLRPCGFARPHNSFLVNMEYVENYDSIQGTICLQGGVFTVSRNEQEHFMKEMTRFLNEKYRENSR